MITTIAGICDENGIDPFDTIYRDSPAEMKDFKIVSGDYYEFKERRDGALSLYYKNTVEILDFPNLCDVLPELSAVDYTIRDELPYFTAGLDKLSDAITTERKVAVEGGPCLFGTDEVIMEVCLKDGSKERFDYNTGKAYLDQGGLSESGSFAQFFVENASKVQAIHFKNRKIGLTPQEWAFIKYPFEIAKALDAPLVIPIPDMSYIKYLEAVISEVDPKVVQEALQEFRFVEYQISDLYLEVIDKMRALNPSVKCEVLHERDTELCQKYYRAREPYIERSRVIRKLTGIPDKLESIKDYVSMPALPYYLFEIPDCLEIDSMDETDSYRKCCFAHKKDINLSCILFPELLSQDKIHTIFEAEYDLKEYGQYEIE